VNGPSFWGITETEIRKLFSRLPAKVGLVMALLIGIGIPTLRGAYELLGVYIVTSHGGTAVGTVDPAWLMYLTLFMRNLFVMRVVLIVLVSLLFAGEFQGRTLREDLLRPVTRTSVLVAKWAALVVYCGVNLGLTLIPGSIIAVIGYGTHGDWADTTLRFAATFLADSGFCALALLIAVASRSVPGTIAGMFLFYVTDLVVGAGLSLVAAFPKLPMQEQLRSVLLGVKPFMPSSAFAAWNGGALWSDQSWTWQSFTSLAVITLLSLVMADQIFRRMDVP
jgi:ABC-type transport system involved in multi-copper enzyme maturation permease subunit